MKHFRKIFMAATMVLTLGATISCNKSEPFKAGTPYTIVAFDNVQGDVKFDCEGEPTVYWNNLEEASSEKSHYFNEITDAYVVIGGKISKLWFCNQDGEPLALANEKMIAITLSNTITSIPKKAFSNIDLHTAYIPSSVKQVGENAFFPLTPSAFYCEAASRPNGWADNWCTVKDFSNLVNWGFSYYVTEDGMLFTLSNDKNAYYEGNLYFETPSVPTIEIPETINVNNTIFRVVGIQSAGYIVNDVIEKITLPKTITYISSSAFDGCRELKEIKFADKYNNLHIGSEVFDGCENLESVTLPEGLTKISSNLFYNCARIKFVKIPSSVKTVGEDIFKFSCAYVEQGLTVDLTAYTDANSIANCDQNVLSACLASNDSGGVIFKIDSNLEEKNFTDKGWPETFDPGVEPSPIKVTWVEVPKPEDIKDSFDKNAK
ncbi:MAG: leucine-rich repeat domain-containing protein [Bacilli bacterium]|nr:leucine-rich repeat domain-containing protein [Bacilli bacterium]